MSNCRNEFEEYEKCKRDEKSCDKQYDTLQKCRTGFFYECRTKHHGVTYRPSSGLEFNAKGPNVILHEDEHIVIGSQGVEFKIFGFKL